MIKIPSPIQPKGTFPPFISPVKALFYTVKTKSVRNQIPSSFRHLDSQYTTMCFVEEDGVVYKLTTNPDTDYTLDSDWETALFNPSTTPETPIGTWNINNATPELTDAGAEGKEGQYYYVWGAPTSTEFTDADLFEGNTKSIKDGDIVVSVGTHWAHKPAEINFDVPDELLVTQLVDTISDRNDVARWTGMRVIVLDCTGDGNDNTTDGEPAEYIYQPDSGSSDAQGYVLVPRTSDFTTVGTTDNGVIIYDAATGKGNVSEFFTWDGSELVVQTSSSRFFSINDSRVYFSNNVGENLFYSDNDGFFLYSAAYEGGLTYSNSTGFDMLAKPVNDSRIRIGFSNGSWASYKPAINITYTTGSNLYANEIELLVADHISLATADYNGELWIEDDYLGFYTSSAGQIEIGTFGFTLQKFATDPLVVQEGSIFYNTTDKALKFYNGTSWKEIIDWTNATENLITTGQVLGERFYAIGTGIQLESSGVVFWQSGINSLTINAASVTGINTVTIPDKSGTIALLSDITGGFSVTGTTDNGLITYDNATGQGVVESGLLYTPTTFTVNASTSTFSGDIRVNGGNILGISSTGSIQLSGSSSPVTGSNIILYGNTHASFPNDIAFLAGSSELLRFDLSNARWNYSLTYSKLYGITEIKPNDSNYQLTVQGGGSSGAKVVMSGSASTDPNDLKLYAGSNVSTGRIAFYTHNENLAGYIDEGSNEGDWNFQGNALTNFNTFNGVNGSNSIDYNGNKLEVNNNGSSIYLKGNAISSGSSDNLIFQVNAGGTTAGSITTAGVWGFSNNRLTSVADPTSAQDAATKNYVDTNAGTSGLLKKTVTITSAEMLALNSTPKQLLAAAGAGNYYNVFKVVISVDYNSAAYATATGLIVEYSLGGTDIVGPGAAASGLTATGDYAWVGEPDSTIPEINSAIQITAAGGDPTAGNSDFKITLYYTIESI